MKRLACLVMIVSLSLSLMPAIAAAQVKLQRGAIPIGLYKHVFPFRYKSIGGTCFVVDVDNRQYILTARHLCPNINDGDAVQLYISEAWQAITIKPVFPKSDKTDIVALATNRLIAPKMDFVLAGEGLIIGQDVYFLGFPFLELELASVYEL